MPKFYFDISDGDVYTRDDEGTELCDRGAARQEALGCMPELARSKLPEGHRRDFVVDVRDEADQVIFTATLSLTARWLDGQKGTG